MSQGDGFPAGKEHVRRPWAMSVHGGGPCSWREQEQGRMTGEEVEGEMASRGGFYGSGQNFGSDSEGNGET